MFDRLFAPLLVVTVLALVPSGDAVASNGTIASVPSFTLVARNLGPAPLTQQIHLVVHLPYPDPAKVASFVAGVSDRMSHNYGAFLTPAQFAATYGPHGYSQVEYVLHSTYGFQIVQSYADQKVIDLVGTVAQAEALLGTTINDYSYKNVTYYANSGPALVPSLLANSIMAVTGLTNFVHKVGRPPSVPSPLGPAYTPLQIQTAYQSPIRENAGIDGRGTTMAIETVYDYLDSDLNTFLNAYRIRRSGSIGRVYVADPVPVGFPLPIQNQETTFDVEQTAANDPGGNILVYEASDPLDATFADLYAATVNDPRVDLVTTSWGSCELGDDPSEIAAENDLFMQAAAEGQTWFAASGDNGAYDCGQNDPPYGLPGQSNPAKVDFPASSPYVTGVGGTSLVLSKQGTYGSETAWPGSGGGGSSFFSLPWYQKNIQRPANPVVRNVPDVALSADPNRPYAFAYAGSFASPVGGTSGAAPNVAAIYAQIAGYYQRRLGMAHTTLYGPLQSRTYPGGVFHDVFTGNNGRFNATPQYDDVTGVGSIDGYALMRTMIPPRVATKL